MRVINDNYTGVNGANGIYSNPILKGLNYTDNVKEILHRDNIYTIVFNTIYLNRRKCDDYFQVWEFKRVDSDLFSLNKKDENHFVLKGSSEDEEGILQEFFSITFDLSSVSFDYLKLWVIDDLILLPEEY